MHTASQPLRLAVVLAFVILGVACATAGPSRKWIVPPTPAAEACVDDCAESRTLCVRRPTRSDIIPDETRRNEGEGYVHLGFNDDAMRQQNCDAVFEDCVGLCPGVAPR